MGAVLPVYTIAADAPLSRATAGTKAEFWFEKEPRGVQWLFKRPRPGSGEDWAEVVAADCAERLGVPHAEYELATFEGARGVITKSVVPAEARLAEGNQVMAQRIPDYPVDSPRRLVRIPAYTVDNVLDAIAASEANAPPGLDDWQEVPSALAVFVGYLMLDALIADSDRHHRNWAIIEVGGDTFLAPTFDHASSLGRSDSDARKRTMLQGRDPQFNVRTYARRGRSRFIGADGRPMGILDAFAAAAARLPVAARAWGTGLGDLEGLPTLLERIPNHLISPVGRDFAWALVQENRRRVQAVLEALP